MGITGLLLLAFCLVGFAAAMLQCPTRVAVRCASSGQQICCPTELVDLHAVILPVPSATGPPRWAVGSWHWPNHLVQINKFRWTADMLNGTCAAHGNPSTTLQHRSGKAYKATRQKEWSGKSHKCRSDPMSNSGCPALPSRYQANVQSGSQQVRKTNFCQHPLKNHRNFAETSKRDRHMLSKPPGESTAGAPWKI